MTTKNIISALRVQINSNTGAYMNVNYTDSTGEKVSSAIKYPFQMGTTIVSIDGVESPAINNLLATSVPTYSISNTLGIALLLGNGTTAPTSSDYKLENIITDYEVVSQSTAIKPASQTYADTFLSITRIIKNNTSENITISELGCFVCNSIITNSMMIAREVLDTPVTIASGLSYAFTMTIGL